MKGDSRTRPILSMLLTWPSSGPPVVQVVHRPSAPSYSADGIVLCWDGNKLKLPIH